MSSLPPLHPMGSGFYYRDRSAPATEDAPLFERWKTGIETNSYNGIILGKFDLLKSLYLVTSSDTLLIDEFHDAQGKSVFKIVPINEQRVLFQSVLDGEEDKFAFVDYMPGSKNTVVGIGHWAQDGRELITPMSELIRPASDNSRYDPIFLRLEFLHQTGDR